MSSQNDRIGRYLIYSMILIAAGALIYLMKPRNGIATYQDRGTAISLQRQEEQTNISIAQTVIVQQHYRGKDFQTATITYTPCNIGFQDFQDIPELPKQLPFPWLEIDQRENLPSSSIVRPTSEDFRQDESQGFALPFIIEGKKRVSPETLDTLIATNQVRPLQEYSLGAVTVNYDTLQCVHIKVEGPTKGLTAFRDEDGYNSPDYSSGTFNKYQKNYHGIPFLGQGVLNRFDDSPLQNLVDEIVWQTSQVEAIEGLLEQIRQYEATTSTPVTHFAIRLEQYGLEGTFQSDSFAKGRMLGSRATANAEITSRFAIKMSGIIATDSMIYQ